MQYIAPEYTCFEVDISNDINFCVLCMLVALKSMLHVIQIHIYFKCLGSNIFMSILDINDVKHFLSYVSNMPPNMYNFCY